MMSCRTRLVRRTGALFRQPLLARTLNAPLALSCTASIWPILAPRRRMSYAPPDSKLLLTEGLTGTEYANVRATAVSQTSSHIHIQLDRQTSLGEPEALVLPKIWLRDICPCPHCVSPSSGQKNFVTCDIDLSLYAKSMELTEHGALQIVWSQDPEHTSVYSLEHIISRYLLSRVPKSPIITKRSLWDRQKFEHGLETRNVTYSDWIKGGDLFTRAIQNLSSYGLIVIKNVPQSHAAVEEIGERIGPLMETFYGRTWDVVSKPDAENVAYTNQFLGLHQDLLYHSPVPKIQLLHCLANDCEGGDSLFSDGLLAFYQSKKTSAKPPGWWTNLTQTEVPYWYTRNGNNRYRTHPIVSVGRSYAIPLHINWSPPFQAPMLLTPPYDLKAELGKLWSDYDLLKGWWEAARLFQTAAENPENMWQYKMNPGDCVVFDNRRILHGRTSFEASQGQRHLRGAYLDEMTFNKVQGRHGINDVEHTSTAYWSRVKFAIAEGRQAAKILRRRKPVNSQDVRAKVNNDTDSE